MAKESCWAAEKASLVNGISVVAPDAGRRSVANSHCLRPSYSRSSRASQRLLRSDPALSMIAQGLSMHFARPGRRSNAQKLAHGRSLWRLTLGTLAWFCPGLHPPRQKSSALCVSRVFFGGLRAGAGSEPGGLGGGGLQQRFINVRLLGGREGRAQRSSGQARGARVNAHASKLQSAALLGAYMWDARLLDEVEARCWAVEKASDHFVAVPDTGDVTALSLAVSLLLVRLSCNESSQAPRRLLRSNLCVLQTGEPSDVAANPGTGPAHASRPSGGGLLKFPGGWGGATPKNLLHFQLLFLSCLRGQDCKSDPNSPSVLHEHLRSPHSALRAPTQTRRPTTLCDHLCGHRAAQICRHGMLNPKP